MVDSGKSLLKENSERISLPGQTTYQRSNYLTRKNTHGFHPSVYEISVWKKTLLFLNDSFQITLPLYPLSFFPSSLVNTKLEVFPLATFFACSDLWCMVVLVRPWILGWKKVLLPFTVHWPCCILMLGWMEAIACLCRRSFQSILAWLNQQSYSSETPL